MSLFLYIWLVDCVIVRLWRVHKPLIHHNVIIVTLTSNESSLGELLYYTIIYHGFLNNKIWLFCVILSLWSFFGIKGLNTFALLSTGSLRLDEPVNPPSPARNNHIHGSLQLGQSKFVLTLFVNWNVTEKSFKKILTFINIFALSRGCQ